MKCLNSWYFSYNWLKENNWLFKYLFAYVKADQNILPKAVQMATSVWLQRLNPCLIMTQTILSQQMQNLSSCHPGSCHFANTSIIRHWSVLCNASINVISQEMHHKAQRNTAKCLTPIFIFSNACCICHTRICLITKSTLYLVISSFSLHGSSA
jgi:hypothetical protein